MSFVPGSGGGDTAAAPADYTPFSGKGQRLADGGEAGVGGASGAGAPASSWALTFASNLELARSSRRRSHEEAHKTYHWTTSARAVKATQTGTASYAKGRQAGEKRKGEIDGVSGSARQKFRRGQQLALAQ